eukprot:380188_1
MRCLYLMFNLKIRKKSPKSIHGTLSRQISKTKITKEKIIRIAFKNIFEPNSGKSSMTNSLNVTTTQLWGYSNGTSLQRLQKELNDEATDNTTLDYPEFESAMSNLGVLFKKDKLISLYSYFLEEQNKSNIRKELNIEFFIKYLGETVKNHQQMVPKQIIEAGFGQVLLKGLKK